MNIKELSNVLLDAVHNEAQLDNLRKEYNKLSRILRCIIENHNGKISKNQWKWVNSTDSFSTYAYGTSGTGVEVTNVSQNT